ncbi:MAG TPA: ATP-dependent DNA ligase [Acidimicrobiales bacterium]|nr:ATP-dependent DNA ligase [Acidimicrobiales bacterium]
MTLFADLVATSDAVAATSKRTEKIAALAALLSTLDVDEVESAVAMLTGAPRQGRIGVGWRTLYDLEVTPASSPSLAVLDIDVAVDRLAACAGAGSNAERTRILTDLFERAIEGEQSFVRRLLTGELRQGALEGVMADAIAKASGVPAAPVRRAAMLSGDLARTACVALADGAEGLAAIRLEVGRPVLPMLAATSPDVAAAIGEVGLASVEWKLDGARIQVHRDGDEVRLYTRNLNEVTSRLPSIVAGVLAMPARSFVLDGEAMGWLEDETRPGVFQDTMSSFGRQDGVAGASLGARFFDVLHVDGEDLLDAPLTERHARLDALVGPLAIPRLVTDDPDAAKAFADDALALGHEGVMVKAADSRYEAGRRGSSWRKVKPVRTLDLIVIGVEWGSGRRRGWLSNLHLGARDPDGGPPVMVGKTFKGLTDALLTWQTEHFKAIEVSDDGHVVVVRPETVVEIALDGVQRSTRYAGGVALRFARVKRYREDKTPAEADTIDDVRALLR